MIVLDTHVWVWWVHGDAKLPKDYAQAIAEREGDGLGVSVISCWEVAKLVEFGRLVLPTTLDEWMDQALAYPGIRWTIISVRPIDSELFDDDKICNLRVGRCRYRRCQSRDRKDQGTCARHFQCADAF